MADSSFTSQTEAQEQPSSKRTKGPLIYPEPFTVSPASQHKQTLLLLHGRGSNGEKFGLEFLASRTSDGKSIREHFPGMQFIFPTAKKRRAKSYNRALIHQWFDNVPVDEQGGRMSRNEVEWQLEGLAETAKFPNPVLDHEVAAVGAKNVFIGGLSQGCAMGAHLLLSYQPKDAEGIVDGSFLGGFIGMSGWLPFVDDIQDLIQSREKGGNAGEEDNDDPFSTSDDVEDCFDIAEKGSQLSPAAQVCNFVRDNMELPPSKAKEPPFLRTPVFIGHGKGDEKVKMGLGLELATGLRKVGLQVRWEEYDKGHWYKVPEEIDDIVDFLKSSA